MGDQAHSAEIDPVNDASARPFPEGPFVWIRPGARHAMQHHLGRKLQTMYAELEATPMPDHLAQLLMQLDTTYSAD